MFERYTEKARRVIFFARYEASQFGSPYIETEHLLLGLLREDKALANRFLRSPLTSIGSIRKQIEGRTTVREKVSTSVDLPLSQECKHILAYAAEEAERLSHRHIGTEHLLLGILTLHLSSLLAYCRQSGLDEERLQTIIKQLVKKEPIEAYNVVKTTIKELTEANAIIFVEELFAAGGAEGSLDAANILRPALSD